MTNAIQNHPHQILIRDKGVTSDDNEIHLLEGDDVKRAKVELWIASALGEALQRHYPTRMFTISVDITAGVVVVKLPEVSQVAGYVLSLQRSLVELEGQMKRVGGEILERGGLTRGRYHDDGDVSALPRDFKDDVTLSDVEAPEQAVTRKGKAGEAKAAQAVAAKAIDELRRSN